MDTPLSMGIGYNVSKESVQQGIREGLRRMNFTTLDAAFFTALFLVTGYMRMTSR